MAVNSEKTASEAARLGALFPSLPQAEVAAVLAILPPDKGARLADGQPYVLPQLVSEEVRLLTWHGRPLAIPYRIYYQEPAGEEVQRLASQQRQVLHCLYLRHHDGFVRQRHLEQLLGKIRVTGSKPRGGWPVTGLLTTEAAAGA